MIPNASKVWSVVICVYTQDRWDLINRSIESVLHQDDDALELIVVVDHNADLLRRLVDRFGKTCAVVSNRYERGLSGARNTGVEASGGEFVAFLDDDAVAGPRWIRSLRSAQIETDAAGVGGLVVPEWESGQPPRWLPEEFLWVVGCSYKGLPATRQPVRNPIGANMAFRRSDIIEVGGFSSRLGRRHDTPAGCEETELAIEIGRRGGGNVYDPAASVDHFVGIERTQFDYFRKRCVAEGRSKALLASGSGVGRATSTERSYVVKTLLGGFVRRVATGLVTLDSTAFLQAGAIALGLGFTTFGFLQGSLRKTESQTQEPDIRSGLQLSKAEKGQQAS